MSRDGAGSDAAAVVYAIEIAGLRIAQAIEAQTRELTRVLDNLR